MLTADPKSETGAKFNKLFAFTRDCRKIIRLLKFLTELEKLEKLLAAPQSTQQQLGIVAAIGMFNYWFFDNLTYLVKGGMIKDNPNYAKWSMLGWNVGITCQMILDSQAFVSSLDKERALRQQLGLPATGLLDMEMLQTLPASSIANDPNSTSRQELVKLYSARVNLLLNFVKNGGDWLISANPVYLPQLIGRPLSDGVTALAGVVSGLAVIAQVYRAV